MSLVYALTGLGLALTAVLVWGFAVEPHWLEVVRFRVPIPNLPPAWEGRTVAVLSDFQVGCRGATTRAARRAVAVARDEGAALALFAGDFVYQARDGDAECAVGLLHPLVEAGVPTFAVLGNHDYRLNLVERDPDLALAGAVEAAAEALGVRVLENEHVAVEPPGGGAPLWVVGVGSEWAGRADVERAFAGLDAEAPRIVLLHHPAPFLRIPARRAPLAVAGHTHGGQIRLLPFVHEIKLLGDAHLLDGWGPLDHGREGNRLYVNRGIGFSWLPVRIGARPELTLIELTAAAPGEAVEAERVEVDEVELPAHAT